MKISLHKKMIVNFFKKYLLNISKNKQKHKNDSNHVDVMVYIDSCLKFYEIECD